MPLIVGKVVTHPVRIPYPRTITWGAHSEDCADYLLIEIVTESGLSGVAEGTVKVNWTGTTLRSLAISIEEVFAPLAFTLGSDGSHEGLAAFWNIAPPKR